MAGKGREALQTCGAKGGDEMEGEKRGRGEDGHETLLPLLSSPSLFLILSSPPSL